MENQEFTPSEPIAPTPEITEIPETGAVTSFPLSKFKLVDYFIAGLYVAVGIYGLVYIHDARKKLKANAEEIEPIKEEFENMNGDIEEVKYNLKKALGKRYKTL
jgi:hypothetical protein